MIQVKTFYAHNELRNFSYLIYDDHTGKSWVVDPYEATPLIEYIKKNGLVLDGILNTHQHFDHIRGNAPLQEAFGSPIRKLNGGERLRLGEDQELEIIDSPGHTMDHQVFVWREAQLPLALFSGDTLFNAGVGNCRNGGRVESLYSTVQKLMNTLPPETLLFPGHDYLERNLLFAKTLEPNNSAIDANLQEASAHDADHRRPRTLEEEFEINPFMRLDSEELQEKLLEKGNSLEDEDQIRRDLFYKLRSLRDKW